MYISYLSQLSEKATASNSVDIFLNFLLYCCRLHKEQVLENQITYRADRKPLTRSLTLKFTAPMKPKVYFGSHPSSFARQKIENTDSNSQT